jgi:folylpolyglutamate synthase/dihydropteroate synthase
VAELASAAEELEMDHEVAGSVPDAVATALEIASPSDLVCITGSHYVVGEARTYLDA